MELLSVIRRWRYRQQFSIREIARRTGLSRNTVRKYLRSDSVEPQFNTSRIARASSTRSPTSCRTCCGRRRRSRASRSGRSSSCTPIWSPSATTAPTIAWRPSRASGRRRGIGSSRPAAAARSCRWRFMPGEAFQFDWSEDWAIIAGERTKLQVAQFKLSYSRAFFLRAYPQQTHEMLFDAHNHAFRVLGGVPRRGIYDNMRTAVDKVGRGKERQVNARFSAMVSHFLFEAEFCNPASGWEKGQIEKNVQDARHRLWQPMPNFPSLAALNDWLEARCQELWAEIPHGAQPGTIADAWREEVPQPDAALRGLSTASSNTPSGSRRPASSIWSATATACRPPSPTAPSACAFTPSASSSSPKGRSFASTRRVFARSHDRQERDGLRLAALSRGHPAQARRPAQWRALRRTAGRLQDAATAPAQDSRAATGRWSRSSPWSSSTTSRPC